MFKSKTKNTLLLDNQMMAFLARQLAALKEVSQALYTWDIAVCQGRINQCVHLIENKIKFVATENPQQYYDYIQDFYENQLMSLRVELSQLKAADSLKNKEICNLKQNLLKESKQSSQKVSQMGTDFEQVCRLHKELEQSKLLIEENSNLLQEQNLAIKNLTKALKNSQKQTKKVKLEYQNKLIGLDEQISTSKEKFNQYFNTMVQGQKGAEQSFKEFSINSIRAVENTNMLAQQLEVKYEEIKLLTKKVFDSEVLCNKLERQLAAKESIIEELELELQRLNFASQEIKNRQNEERIIGQQKEIQAKSLEQRIQILNSTNSELQRRYLEKSQKESKLEKQLKEKRSLTNDLESKIISLQNMISSQKNLIEDKNYKIDNLANEKSLGLEKIKGLEESVSQLVAQNRAIKNSMKESIMEEVQELLGIIEKQKDSIRKISKQYEGTAKLYQKSREQNEQLQRKFNTVTSTMDDISQKIAALQQENHNLLDTNNLLSIENTRLNHRNNQLLPLETQCIALRDQTSKLEKTITSFGNQASQQMNQKNRSLEQIISSLQNELKLAKQTIHKKDFHIKQHESRIKILQEDLRSISILYENEKVKMSKKVKQLEELLKEDLTSRKSCPSNNF